MTLLRRVLFAALLAGALFQTPAFADAPAPEGTAANPASPAGASEKNEALVPIQVKGDNVEYFHEEEKAIGTGNVSIDYEGSRLTADKITVFMKQKTALAEGNVTLTQEGATYKGQRAEYDYARKVGTVTGMAATIEPGLHGKAKQVEIVSEGHYRMKDAYFTTCDPCNDNPFYRVQAKSIDIYPGKKVVVKNALILVKGIPVFFVPVYVQPLVNFDRFPVQLVPGKNSEWGPFLLSRWRYELADSPSLQSKGNIQADYRIKRGVGVGVENFYKGDKIGRGAARVYYADDHDAPPLGETKGRYRGQLRHQVPLTPDTTLTAEFNKQSDPEIVKDFFFDEEYERDAFPDTYVSLITSKPEYTLSFLERERVDDFYTVVERSPEVRFDTHNRRFAETPFYLRQEFQFANLKKEFARSENQLDVMRFDVNQTLSYDGQIGPVSVTPRVGTRQTYYSRRLEDSEDLVRATFDPGLDISTRFYRTYNKNVHKWGLDYNGIRHIFTPTASYNFRPNPTAPRTILQQFDAIDALDKRNFIRFQFENKFQTKHHEKGTGALYTREIARVIPFFDMDFDTKRLENIGYDVELRPYSWLGIESDALYDPRQDNFETVNFDFYLGEKDGVQVGVGHRYVRDESSLLTTEVRWTINPEYSVRVYERFEFDDDESEEFEITLSKTFECVIADFTYNHREGDTFFVVLRLKGFPKASFGLSQSYNRPKASPGRL